MTDCPAGKGTFDPQRTMLAVVRNRASVFRMLEILRLFDNDDRIAIRMTIGLDSRYDHGVDELLASQRIRPLSWDEARQSTFDLVISSSTHPCLHELTGPVIVFPHGAGHHKHSPDTTIGGVFELASEQLTHNGSVIPAKILLPGRESRHRLEGTCHTALPYAEVAGDPIAQQIREHLSLRDAYRGELGLRPGQRLVVVASTYGPGSLAGQSLDLLKRLVAELPVDEFRVAAAFHHNVTIHDGQRELERMLRAAIDSGLILIPPAASWQTAVIAADGVIGDHGSATFYASEVVPVAVAAHDPNEYPADSPVAALIGAVPHIDEELPLRPQVEDLLAMPRSAAVAAIVDASIERDIDAAGTFRSIMFDLMRLPEPANPARLPLDMPKIGDVREPTAFRVDARITDEGDTATVTLERYPAAIASHRQGRFLITRTDDESPRRREIAAALVLVHTEPGLGELSARWPHCELAVKPVSAGEFLLRLRDGTEFLAATEPVADVDTATIVASACCGLVRAKRAIPSRFTVNCGQTRIAVDVRRSTSG